MKTVVTFRPAYNYFQIGWNASIMGGNLETYYRGLNMWQLYDFTLGITAAIHRHNLPSDWLE